MNQPASAAESPQLLRLALRDAVALTLLVMAAAGLRLPQLQSSLWLDELHTAWTVADGLSQIAPRAAEGHQGPLHSYLSAAAVAALGNSEWALRAPSLAAGLLLVGVIYAAVLRWTSLRGAAILAALLVALDRDMLFYSLEARPYSLVQLGGLLHVLVWSRVVRQPTAGWRLLAVSGAALLFYLHYTAALLFVAELAWLAGMRWLRPADVRYRPGQLALDATALALLMLPAAPHVLWIASRRANWEAIITPRPISELLSVFPLACYLLPPLAIAALCEFVQRARQTPAAGGQVRWDIAALAGCWLAVPLLAAWLATQWGIAPLLLRRYVIVATAAPIVLSAVLYAACPLRTGRAVCFLVVAGCAAITPSGLAIGPAGEIALDGPLSRFAVAGEFIDRPREDWRAAVTAINNDAAASHLPLLVRSGLIEDDALRAGRDQRLHDYCLFPVRGLYRIDESNRALTPLPSTNSGRLCQAVQQEILDRGGAWLLLRASAKDAESIAADVTAGLEARGADVKLTRHDDFGGVVLVKLLSAR